MTPTEPESTTSPTRGLSYEGRLPLAWREAEPPEERELRELEHNNATVLRTLFALETYSGEASEELPEADAQAVARLDFKLNLLLDLVGYLLAKQQDIPDPHPLTLTPSALYWRDDQGPSKNSMLRIEIYCSMRYPRPLILYAQVMELTPQPDGWLVGAEFRGLGERVQEGLERFIFLHHRRTISHKRRYT